MEPNTMVTLAKMGAAAALGIAAMGSALGCGTAGMSAITMWKKAYAQGKSALFTLLVFVGAPISQTIYGMLLMNFILSKAAESGFTNWGGCLGAGIFGGLGMMASAWYQGKSAAVACDALGETGKGMVNYPVSQKRLGVSESCWREDQQQGQFFNVHLAGPVAWGARYRGNRGPVRSRVLHDAGIVG